MRELNPVEGIWSHTKYADPPNFAPDNLDTLEGAVLGSLAETRRAQALFVAFIRAAGPQL